MQDYEKLGAFYLGRLVDPQTAELGSAPFLYDAKDLTTHAVCVGMTGSGKTGLGVTLLEEAALDGVPALVVDPKGDLGNLLLTFESLSPEEFAPWVEPEAAARHGQSAEAYARTVSERWRRGLADWGQDAARIARLRQAVDMAIYTPGSTAGLPLRVLAALEAPEAAGDEDAFRERVGATVAGLLALIGLEADPLKGRETILLANLLDRLWRAEKPATLPHLIRSVQQPPFDTIGVMDLETIYPARARRELAMRLNHLLASPGFAAWMDGEPLDIQRLLYTPAGQPRISILSISHLSDAERMFFVTLVLSEVVAWMRKQPGAASLRALLYMDEVFGYLPPVANPPSKRPLLTLLKQARAYGLGTVLATQNPVDLDYKALSNAGTWFLGRLQTERDKERVLDGLEGASATTGATFDRAEFARILSGLKSRVFLMNNVHEDAPVLFQTRWAMSYLRGPLTRVQIATLMERRQPPAANDETPPARAVDGVVDAAARGVVPGDVAEAFVPPETGGAGEVIWQPALIGAVNVHYANARLQVERWQKLYALVELTAEPETPVWATGTWLKTLAWDLEAPTPTGGRFVPLPPAALRAKSYTTWAKQLASHVYQTRPLAIYKCREPRIVGVAGETRGAFQARLMLAAREARDRAIAKLKTRYDAKLDRLAERIRKAEARLEREGDQYSQRKLQALISVGATVLGGLFGRKASSRVLGRATTAVRGIGRAAEQRGDIDRAAESVEAYRSDYTEIEAELQSGLEKVRDAYEAQALEVETVTVRPRKSDTTVERLWVAWMPWRRRQDGALERAYAVPAVEESSE